jgi:uncharacterized protein YjbI with pentapeptide repeats
MKIVSKLNHLMKKQLSGRWKDQAKELSYNSPFGTTTVGLKDFRGFSFPFETGTKKISVVGKAFKSTDFSCADFSNIVMENCTFEDCVFTSSVLNNIILAQCNFLRCFFPYTDFTEAGIGIDGGEFNLCEFLRPKLTRISFHVVTFKNIEFDGKDWSHVSFGVADFWNCCFRGVFKDCEFQNGRMPKKLIELAGSRSFGFHNVDLSGAEFTLAGFPPNWVFEDVAFPLSKSVKLVRVDTLREALKIYPAESQRSQIIEKYLAIFVLDAPSHQLCFVSKHDLIDLGDAKEASEIFADL